MQRLSDLIIDLPCAHCGQPNLNIARVNLGANAVTASVLCRCGKADMLRWNYGELGKIREYEVPPSAGGESGNGGMG